MDRTPWQRQKQQQMMMPVEPELICGEEGLLAYEIWQLNKWGHFVIKATVAYLLGLMSVGWYTLYRGADKSLARPTSRCILFYG